MNKLPYLEGDVFSVPLQHGGIGVGVITRVPAGGKVLVGYFFGPKLDAMPDQQYISNLQPDRAIKIWIFGDSLLKDGSWSIIGRISNWSRGQWPTPKFLGVDPLSNKAWLISYADDDPRMEIGRERCEPEIQGYEKGMLLGSALVVAKLSKLLNSGADK